MSDPQISEAAARWVVDCHEPGGLESGACDRAALERWLAADPRHRRAYDDIRRLWTASATPAPNRRGRRAVAAGLVLAALAAGWGLAHERAWLADERTAAGEIRTLDLADGSTLTLDSDSAVDLDFSAAERRVTLRRGRVLASVAHDAARPFVVRDADGAVTALGTRYVVEARAHDSVARVLESRVRVTADSGAASELAAGWQLTFDARGVGRSEPATPLADAWANGRLAFDATPLPEVLATLSRYRRTPLLADADVAGLRFTGVLPATDPDAALTLLAQSLDLQPETRWPWGLRLVRRP